MGDGFEGFNPSRVKAQIKEMNDLLSSIQNAFVESSIIFFKELSNNWFSPKAVEFGDSLIKKAEDLDREIIYLDENIIDDCFSAYNEIATANGLGTTYPDETGPFKGAEYSRLLEISPNGAVGIQVENVKNIVQEYKNKLEDIKYKLSLLPRRMDFYDKSGIIAEMINNRVNRINDLVDESVDTLSTKLMMTIEQEFNLQTNSVQRAQEILSKN